MRTLSTFLTDTPVCSHAAAVNPRLGYHIINSILHHLFICLLFLFLYFTVYNIHLHLFIRRSGFNLKIEQNLSFSHHLCCSLSKPHHYLLLLGDHKCLLTATSNWAPLGSVLCSETRVSLENCKYCSVFWTPHISHDRIISKALLDCASLSLQSLVIPLPFWSSYCRLLPSSHGTCWFHFCLYTWTFCSLEYSPP